MRVWCVGRELARKTPKRNFTKRSLHIYGETALIWKVLIVSLQKPQGKQTRKALTMAAQHCPRAEAARSRSRTVAAFAF